VHRFFALKVGFEDDRVNLGDSEAHHLRDVLRHAVGDEVHVFDGNGGEYRCRVDVLAKRSATLAVLGIAEPAAPESPLDLTIAAALLKGEKFDLVVKKCVELGVTRFVPLNSVRCDVRYKDGEKRQERWHKMAVDAARQCGRATLMKVEQPVDFAHFAGVCGKDGTRILFSERNGESATNLIAGTKITAFVGPEGGWDDRELHVAEDNQFTILRLGGRILRAETAAIAVATILQHRFGDLN
jgi:16S rRNA (uracil1498-N3)-methyltransferase